LAAGVAQSTNVFFASCATTCFYALPLLVLLSAGCFGVAAAFSAESIDAGPDHPIIAPTGPAGDNAGREGNRAALSGDHVGAIKLLTRAIELLGPKDPATAYLYLDRGASYRQLGQFDQALQDVDEALKFPTLAPVGHYDRGMVLMSMKRHEEALAEFDDYLAKVPKSALVYFKRGLALSALGRFKEEVAAYTKSLQLTPHVTSLLYFRAIANTKAGDIAAAIADYTQHINREPNAGVYHRRGDLYRDTKKYEAAVADYSHVLELDPKRFGVYNDRGNAYLRLGKYEAALGDYTTAIKLDPEEVTAYRNRGLFYLFQGKRDLARADYEQGLKLLPNDQWLKDQLKTIDEIKQK
jgi:tetratricopeptide (TPR) repeat protein